MHLRCILLIKLQSAVQFSLSHCLCHKIHIVSPIPGIICARYSRRSTAIRLGRQSNPRDMNLTEKFLQTSKDPSWMNTVGSDKGLDWIVPRNDANRITQKLKRKFLWYLSSLCSSSISLFSSFLRPSFEDWLRNCEIAFSHNKRRRQILPRRLP